MRSPVVCANCGDEFLKDNREINRARKLGRPHFCSRSCSAQRNAAVTKAPEVVLTCPCGRRFRTTTKKKATKHCSRSCASRYSMSEQRREAQRQAGLDHSENLASVAEVLKSREGWKYAALETTLQGRPHEFEYELGGFVFDLALLDSRVLVEFDGPYHEGVDQRQVDQDKDRAAEAAGFVVVRRMVQPATVIGPNTIRNL